MVKTMVVKPMEAQVEVVDIGEVKGEIQHQEL